MSDNDIPVSHWPTTWAAAGAVAALVARVLLASLTEGDVQMYLRSMRHFLCVKMSGGWCPLCYEGLRGRAVHKGHYGWRDGCGKARERCMGLLRRTGSAASAGPTAAKVSGGDWEKWYPATVEWLSRSSWDDGSARSTGTLMLMWEGGSWKVWAHDRELSEGQFISGATPEQVLESLEKSLTTGVGDWRPDRKAKR